MLDPISIEQAVARVDLLAMVTKDVVLRKVATTNGGEWAGPCPFCGTAGHDPKSGPVDRFRVWPEHPDGRGRWWCRRCNKNGDAIAYVQERQGLGFRDAIEALGLEVEQQSSSGSPPRQRAQEAQRPAVPTVAPPGQVWQERARAFCEYARNQLWSDAGLGVRVYLHEVRGLHEDTIRRFGLGYNPADLWDKPVRRWGLQDGRAVYLSRGIVIPCQADGVLWYVQIRRPRPGGELLAYMGGEPAAWRPDLKYMAIKGSAGKGLFNADSLQGRGVVLMCEGEFDCMLAWQELGERVDVAALGGAYKGNQGLPGRWQLRLWPYDAILAAYDADEAGSSGAAQLAAHSRRVRRVAVPRGGDLVGFWQTGGDLGTWLTEALAAAA